MEHQQHSYHPLQPAVVATTTSSTRGCGDPSDPSGKTMGSSGIVAPRRLYMDVKSGCIFQFIEQDQGSSLPQPRSQPQQVPQLLHVAQMAMLPPPQPPPPSYRGGLLFQGSSTNVKVERPPTPASTKTLHQPADSSGSPTGGPRPRPVAGNLEGHKAEKPLVMEASSSSTCQISPTCETEEAAASSSSSGSESRPTASAGAPPPRRGSGTAQPLSSRSLGKADSRLETTSGRTVLGLAFL